jgi:hypothetical protein
VRAAAGYASAWRSRYATAADVDRPLADDDWCIDPIEEAAMFYPPDTILALATIKQQELIAEADRYRVLRSARAAARRRRAAPVNEPLSRGRPAGTLAACGPRAAAPAR